MAAGKVTVKESSVGEMGDLVFFFSLRQKMACGMDRSRVGSEMCIKERRRGGEEDKRRRGGEEERRRGGEEERRREGGEEGRLAAIHTGFKGYHKCVVAIHMGF